MYRISLNMEISNSPILTALWPAKRSKFVKFFITRNGLLVINLDFEAYFKFLRLLHQCSSALHQKGVLPFILFKSSGTKIQNRMIHRRANF